MPSSVVLTRNNDPHIVASLIWHTESSIEPSENDSRPRDRHIAVGVSLTGIIRRWIPTAAGISVGPRTTPVGVIYKRGVDDGRVDTLRDPDGVESMSHESLRMIGCHTDARPLDTRQFVLSPMHNVRGGARIIGFES